MPRSSPETLRPCAGLEAAARAPRAPASQMLDLTLHLCLAGIAVPSPGPAAAPAEGGFRSELAPTCLQYNARAVQRSSALPGLTLAGHKAATHGALQFSACCNSSVLPMLSVGSALLGPGSAASCAPGYRGEQAVSLCTVPGPQEGSLQARRLLQGEQRSSSAACLGEACWRDVGWLATSKWISDCSWPANTALAAAATI